MREREKGYKANNWPPARELQRSISWGPFGALVHSQFAITKDEVGRDGDEEGGADDEWAHELVWKGQRLASGSPNDVAGAHQTARHPVPKSW